MEDLYGFFFWFLWIIMYYTASREIIVWWKLMKVSLSNSLSVKNICTVEYLVVNLKFNNISWFLKKKCLNGSGKRENLNNLGYIMQEFMYFRICIFNIFL